MTGSPILLLGDTLHIGFHGTGKAPYPEDIVAPGVLRAIAQHLKIDLQTQASFWGDYAFFAGVTGEAFRFLDLMNLGQPALRRPLVARYGRMSAAEMQRQALAAAGLESHAHLKPNLPAKSSLQQQIVASLRDRQTPVIGLGVFGPPEPFLITGYDHAGDALLGWSHFQHEAKNHPDLTFEPTGQFRLPNWYQAIDGVILVTGAKNQPALRETYRTALEDAIADLQTTEDQHHGGPLGTAALSNWAAHLENPAHFAGLSDAQWAKAQTDHGHTAGDLAERRALAASFVKLAAPLFPEAQAQLSLAAAAFQGAHDTVYEIWETIANTGPFDPDLAKFKDPARRQTLAHLVRRLVAFDRRAVACLQRAADILDHPQPSPALPPDDPLLDGNVVLPKADTSPSPHPPLWAPENIALPNTLGMLRAFLGESFGALNDAENSCSKLDYILWMGLSGAAFGLLADGPQRSNLPLVFDALGYDYELWMSKQLAEETALPCRTWGWDDNLRRRIFWNLRDRRLPVLLFRCGPWPDWWLVTQARHWNDFFGYGHNNGESYRPNEPLDDPKNPLRPIAFMRDMKGQQTWTINLLVRRATPKPPLDELYRRAITWGAVKLRQPTMKLLDAQAQPFISAHAYQDWAAMTRTDALFPAHNPAILAERRAALEGDEVELAERRYYGSRFLELAAVRLNRPALKQAAAHFLAAYQLVEQIWALSGKPGTPEAHLNYAQAPIRHAIADLLLQIHREDVAAAELLSA